MVAQVSTPFWDVWLEKFCVQGEDTGTSMWTCGVINNDTLQQALRV